MLRLIATFIASVLFTTTVHAETWHRADTHHFEIYSNGNKGQLEDFAHEVERFDSLLRLLWNKKAVENPHRLTIYLVEDANAVDDILSPGNSNVAGFYSRRSSGSFAVGNRKTSGNKTRLNGKRVLFHEYAHHFMFQNFAVPAPAWFVEGFAEFVATAEFKRNGEWTFGKPALHRQSEVEYFGAIPIRDLLTKRPARGGEGNAFYGWSWALTHMLYSQEMGRGKLASQYINRLNRGEDPLDAAEATFGDLDQFDRTLQRYVKGTILWNKSPNPLPYQDSVSVVKLNKFDSEIVGLTLRRLGGHTLEPVRDDLLLAVRSPLVTSEAWYQLAEVEFDLAHDDDAVDPYNFTAAQAALDRALALDNNHVEANVLKGQLLLEPFDHQNDTDEANWDLARDYFRRARDLDPAHPWPLFSLATSYTREGQTNDEVTEALAAAFTQAPEAPDIRFALAQNKANNGQYRSAISLLQVLANNPHGGDGAQSMIDAIMARMQGGDLSAGSDSNETASDQRQPPEEGDSNSKAP